MASWIIHPMADEMAARVQAAGFPGEKRFKSLARNISQGHSLSKEFRPVGVRVAQEAQQLDPAAPDDVINEWLQIKCAYFCQNDRRTRVVEYRSQGLLATTEAYAESTGGGKEAPRGPAASGSERRAFFVNCVDMRVEAASADSVPVVPGVMDDPDFVETKASAAPDDAPVTKIIVRVGPGDHWTTDQLSYDTPRIRELVWTEKSVKHRPARHAEVRIDPSKKAGTTSGNRCVAVTRALDASRWPATSTRYLSSPLRLPPRATAVVGPARPPEQPPGLREPFNAPAFGPEHEQRRLPDSSRLVPQSDDPDFVETKASAAPDDAPVTKIIVRVGPGDHWTTDQLSYDTPRIRELVWTEGWVIPDPRL
ncbi:hypothetical protein H257_17716 [Aphanomyces astaci]|uniref:Uncharacterized protein n=1 Tax=Aphanomyces astaci TaxID=112090 RepID=W4FDQ0_APHAT|nr:hypothetical protein H257_17716 [Aphanomyces astaci]ETV65607.1 hypothetical protein H257_17716 [Aphanomyces astaci]|eukprot:XP_009844904.1 hypothetical protein H257_17716 [Aphanomyces astaci]